MFEFIISTFVEKGIKLFCHINKKIDNGFLRRNVRQKLC